MRWYGWLIGVILLVAVFVRLYRLGEVPLGLYWDEVAILADARAVAETGRDMHNRPWFQVMYPSYGDYKLPVYIWLASLSVKLAGANEWALRLPSALAGLGTVLVAGYLAHYLLGEFSQPKSKPPINIILRVVVMAVVAVTPWSVMFSRTGFEGHVAQLLVALSVLSMVLSTKWPKVWWLAPILGGLATYGYFSVRFVWPVLLLATAIFVVIPADGWRWRELDWWKAWLLRVGGAGIVFGVCLIPMIRSPLYADSNRFRLGTTSVLNSSSYVVRSNVYRELAGNQLWDRILFHRHWLLVREVLSNYADHLDLNYLFMTGDPNLRHGTGQHGLLSLTLLPFLFWGVSWWWQRRPGVLALLITWWLIALLPASIPEDTPHALRSLNALVPVCLLVAGGITAAIGWFVEVTGSKVRYVAELSTGLAVMVVVVSSWPWWYHYLHVYPQDSFEAWQGNYKQVAETIYQLRQPGEPVAILSFDYRFYLWLLAFGPYPASQYQTWPTAAYLFHDFDGIKLDARDPVVRPTVVAGTVEAVRRLLDEQPLVVSSKQDIPGPTAQSSYIVVEVAPR